MRSDAGELPDVSIVLPTYNRASLVAEAIDSVMQQEFMNWELLIVDDGSTDQTPDVVSAYRADPRICYLYQQNRGQAAARNLGIKNASAAWIAFLDSDDRWLPHKLRIQLAYLALHPGVDVLYGEVERIDFSGRVVSERSKRQAHSGTVWRELLVRNFVAMSTAIVRTEKLIAIGGFDASIRWAEDYDLWLRLSVSSRFQFLEDVVAQYRVAGGRVSDNTIGCVQANLDLVERFLKGHPSLLSPAEIDNVRGRLHSRLAREISGDGLYLQSVKMAIFSIRYWPRDHSAWRTLAAVLAKPFRGRGPRVKSLQ